MERHRQTLEEITSKLSSIQAEWQDDLAMSIMELLDETEEKSHYTADDLRRILEKDFEAGLKGKIARIYTSQMFPDLREDLLRLRTEHGLELKI